jgi:hypothetical protein
MTKTRLLATISILLIVVGLAFVTSGKAGAEPAQISTTFTGFAFEKSEVTLNMKKKIKAWVLANPNYNVASCVGYTGHNVKNRSKAFLEKLATARSKNICDYIRRITGTMTINSTLGYTGDGKTAEARKVTVTLLNASGNDGGTGVVTIGQCDNSLNVSMQSRITASDFYFNNITIRDISASCSGNIMDIYFLDADGNQIASSMANPISKTYLRVSYQLFNPTLIPSNQISKVAFEIRKP